MKKRYRETTTRSKIGVSQEEFIRFLRISKSALAMYETRQRSLAAWPLIKQGAIEICLSKPGIEIIKETIEQEQQELAQQLLREKQIDCTISITRLKRSLHKMQQQYQTCINLLQVAKYLPDLLPTLLPDEKHRTRVQDLDWIEDQKRIALQKIATCGIAHQQLLQLKIDKLQYEFNRIQKLLSPA